MYVLPIFQGKKTVIFLERIFLLMFFKSRDMTGAGIQSRISSLDTGFVRNEYSSANEFTIFVQMKQKDFKVTYWDY